MLFLFSPGFLLCVVQYDKEGESMKTKLIFFLILSLLSVQSVLVAQQTKGPFQTVDQESIERAMEMVLKKDTGTEPAYDPTATPNGVRYQVDVIVYLLENR